MTRFLLLACTAILGFITASPARVSAEDADQIKFCRVPQGGVQPQAAVDATGRIHLIYLRGKAENADIFYVTSTDGGENFSSPLRVNSHEGSAMAIGTVRGPHLALGKAGRPHVAWMGSAKAEPRAPGGASPLLYTRLNEKGDGFESEKNVLQTHAGLDGGGSLAADESGQVSVAWHAPSAPKGNELTRQVWLIRSTDEGETFSDETAMSPAKIGGCGCCGMRLTTASDGGVLALFRSAEGGIDRDMYLLASGAASPSGSRAVKTTQSRAGGTKAGSSKTAPGKAAPSKATLPKQIVTKVAPMTSGTCVMSTAAFAPGPGDTTIAAWETNQQIFWAAIRPGTYQVGRQIPIPREGKRKHPALATNPAGQVLVAWAEDTGWMKGGSLAWQLFDAGGKPVKTAMGRKDGLPTWDLPAVAVRPDGGFVVIY